MVFRISSESEKEGRRRLSKEKAAEARTGRVGGAIRAQSAAVHRLPSGSSPALRWSSVTSRAPSGALPSVTVRETCRRRLERETGRSHRWKRASTHVSRSVTGGQGDSFTPSSDARPRLPFPLDARAVGPRPCAPAREHGRPGLRCARRRGRGRARAAAVGSCCRLWPPCAVPKPVPL